MRSWILVGGNLLAAGLLALSLWKLLGGWKSLGGAVGCFVEDRHYPARHPLGGFRCLRCGTARACLSDFGLMDPGDPRVDVAVMKRREVEEQQRREGMRG